MNGKMAKKLRRIAQGFLPNAPVAAYAKPAFGAVDIALKPNCQRALYQDIKRAYTTEKKSV